MRKSGNIFVRPRSAAYLLMFFFLISMIAACSSYSVTDNSALSLKKNEGLAGFEFLTAYKGGDFMIKLAGFGGRMLKMNNTSAGESIYLYKLSKGRYCVKALFLTGADYYIYLPHNKLPCFQITPGKLTYGGTISNSIADFYSIDLDEFLHSLKSVYPKVYAKYVIGPKPIAHPD